MGNATDSLSAVPGTDPTLVSSLSTDASKKKHHHHPDDDERDRDRAGDRDSFLEAALARRLEELGDLKQAFEEVLQDKKPLDPPTHYGTSVQRAWLHSVDPHDYRDKLECMIDKAESRLEKLEERI